MKFKRQISSMLILFACLSLITACAAKKAPAPVVQQSNAEKAATSIQTVQTDIRTMMVQIDATNASLNQVIDAKGSPDVNKAIDAYSKNVDQMDAIGKTFDAHSTQMAARVNDYVAEWRKSGETTYTDPEIQRLSQEQRNDMEKTFNQIAQSSAEVKGGLNEYVAELKEMRTYLSTNRSPKAIEAISPQAQKVVNDGNQIKSDVQPILADTDRARAEISTTGKAAGGTPMPAK